MHLGYGEGFVILDGLGVMMAHKDNIESALFFSRKNKGYSVIRCRDGALMAKWTPYRHWFKFPETLGSETHVEDRFNG